MLCQHVDDVFSIAMHQWVQFSNTPDTYYLNALEDFYSSRPGKTERLPYVKKMGLLELLVTCGNESIWKRASVIYSLPRRARKWYINRR